MKKCAERPNAVACACQDVAKKVAAAASRPFIVRAGIALLAEITVGVAFVYMRRRVREARAT